MIFYLTDPNHALIPEFILERARTQYSRNANGERNPFPSVLSFASYLYEFHFWEAYEREVYQKKNPGTMLLFLFDVEPTESLVAQAPEATRWYSNLSHHEKQMWNLPFVPAWISSTGK